MSLTAAGDGTLTIAVWPAYVGACQEDPGPGPIAYGEPEATEYQRGQIQWGMENDEIVGRAFIHAGPGSLYTPGLLPRRGRALHVRESPAPTSNPVPTARRDRDLPDHQSGYAIAESTGVHMNSHSSAALPIAHRVHRRSPTR